MRKAIVLAAGRGTRMGKLTDDIPKPMLPVEGRPMLEQIVRRLEQVGTREILIVTGYRREVIEQHFRTGFPGVSFAVQQKQEGTAKAIELGRDFVGGDAFLLTFGDIMCGAGNYTGIGDELLRRSAAAVLGVKNVDDPWQGAAVYVNNSGAVTQILEKPARGTSTTHWNSAGLYAFSPLIFDEIATAPRSTRGEFEIATAIQQFVEHGQPVRMFEIAGAWRDVGRPEDLAHADEDLHGSVNP